MLVSRTHRFIFLKTHKTASTSIAMAFEPSCAPPDHVVRMGTPARLSRYGIVGARDDEKRSWRREEPVWEGHMTAENLRARLPEEWRDFFRFTSVRNPFDRALSQFLYRRRISGAPALASVAAIRSAFSDWLQAGQFRGDSHIVMLDGRIAVDDAIRFEHLKEDASRIAKKLGIALNTDNLPHVRDNADARLGFPVEAFFDDTMRKLVIEVDRWVLEAGYYRDDPLVRPFLGDLPPSRPRPSERHHIAPDEARP